MTAQEVIKNFMAGLIESTASGKNKLDAAVKASSDFSSVQAVIDAMKADQVAAEKEAVEEILGSTYAGKTISQVGSTILNKKATAYNDVYKKSNLYVNDRYNYTSYTTTVKDVLNERKAAIFLEKYCGIQLEKKYWYNSGTWTYWSTSSSSTGNYDTGAITGSDANISLKAGDVVNGTTLTETLISALAQKNGNSLSGDTLIIGTGTEKTERSIVPEIGNKYEATTSRAQNIQTGSNDWIVAATDYNDTITTGGADSISAGAGNDKIIVGADYASILTGAGNDSVEISEDVQNVTIGDLDSNDILTIKGTFQIGSAQIEDTMLVVTDRTGTRKIRLGNLENAKNSKVNGTTLANWLSAAGFNIDNLKSVSSSNVVENPATEEIPAEGGDGRIVVDKDYEPAQIKIPVEDAEDLPFMNANTSGNINVNLDNVTLTSGDLVVDGAKVGEISDEFPNVSSFTKNGLTINLVGVTTSTSGSTTNIQSKTLSELTDDQRTIVAGLFKWWAKECLKLNEESYGVGFNSASTMVKEIGLYFYDSKGSGNTLAAVWNWSSGSRTSKLMLNVNMNYYNGIAQDDFDGKGSSSNALLDRTLAHEFTHAVMVTNISYFNSLPQFIKEGMAELTHGIDDERGHSIYELAADSSKLNTALSVSNTGTGTAEAYSGGYMFLRYFARQAALQSLFEGVDTVPANPLLVTGTDGANFIENTLAGATINALGGKDTISNTGATVSIFGGAGNDSISNSGDNVLFGYNVGDGNDIIQGFNETSTLSISGGRYTSIKSGDNLIFTVGSGKISLIGAATLSALNIDGSNANETWTISGTTATYKIDGETVATVKGLKKGLAASNGVIDGITAGDGKIILSKKVVDTSKITLSVTKGYNYVLAFNDDFGDSLLTVSNKTWTASNGTAILKGDFSAGYSLSEDGKTITYSKTATRAKELARVTGLAKSGVYASDFSTSDNVITLKSSMVATSNIALKGDGYTLAFSANVPLPTLQSEYWTLSGTTATLNQSTSAGFTLSADNKSATYSKAETKSLATLSGLKKNLVVANNNIDGVTVSGDTITLSEKVLGTSNISVSGDYTLDLSSSTTPEETQRWLVNGTNATYDIVQSDYFTRKNNKTFTYNKERVAGNLITIKGLAKGAKVDSYGNLNGVTLNGSTLTISGDNYFGNKVEIKADGYAIDNQLDTPTATKTYWTVKSGTATLKQDVTAGYNLTTNARTGVKTLTYAKAKTETLATISGLNKTLTDNNGSFDGVTVSGDTITLSEKVLGTSNISVSGDYTLDLSSSTTPEETQRWLVNGTNATYDIVQSGYFTRKNSKTFTYNKEKVAGNLITIKGLAKGAKVDSYGNLNGVTLNGSTLTLSGDNYFGNKVEIKADGYAIDNQLDTPTATKTYWTVKSGTATLKQDVTDGYNLVTNARTGVKTLTYAKAKTETLATISGLDKTLTDNNGLLDGLTFDTENKTVTADSRVLGTSNVVVSGDYVLNLDTTGDYAPEMATKVDEVWAVSGTTATLKNVNIGYFTRKNNKTFTYNKEKFIKNLAIVGGINKNADVSTFRAATDGDTQKITLSNNQLSKKVTVSGEYNFEFANDYGNATIIGSASADTIDVAGTNLTVSGGKGNDEIIFSGNGNTFLYANGDGNDVIADFSTYDKIKVTSGKVSVESAGDDVVVKVGNGSIKLTGAAGQTISILDSKNKVTTYATATSYWFTSENSSANAQLDSIVKTPAASYLPENLTSDSTKLTKEKNQIAYSGKK